MSVYWVRADAFTNFAADYVQVLKEIDPNNALEIRRAIYAPVYQIGTNVTDFFK